MAYTVIDAAEQLDPGLLFEQGRQNFAALIDQWLSINHWSYATTVELARCALAIPDGSCWISSSQLCELRKGGPKNPGPRCFIAIAALNRAILDYQRSGKLIRGMSSSEAYADAKAIATDDPRETPGPDWFFLVFCGLITPKAVLHAQALITKANIQQAIKRLTQLLMHLLLRNDRSSREINALLLDAAPKAASTQRHRIRSLFTSGRHLPYEPSTLREDLGLLAALCTHLGRPIDQEQLLLLLIGSGPLLPDA